MSTIESERERLIAKVGAAIAAAFERPELDGEFGVHAEAAIDAIASDRDALLRENVALRAQLAYKPSVDDVRGWVERHDLGNHFGSRLGAALSCIEDDQSLAKATPSEPEQGKGAGS